MCLVFSLPGGGDRVRMCRVSRLPEEDGVEMLLPPPRSDYTA